MVRGTHLGFTCIYSTGMKLFIRQKLMVFCSREVGFSDLKLEKDIRTSVSYIISHARLSRAVTFVILPRQRKDITA